MFREVQDPLFVLTTMVLKIGPNRPVQPGTGAQSGSILLKNRNLRKNEKKPGTAGFNWEPDRSNQFDHFFNTKNFYLRNSTYMLGLHKS